jgi:hypothetical protein
MDETTASILIWVTSVGFAGAFMAGCAATLAWFMSGRKTERVAVPRSQAPVSGTQASFQPASQQPQVATPAAQSAVMPPGAVVNPAPAPAGNQTSVNPAGNQPSTAASPSRRPGSYRELLREQAQQSKGP